MLTRLKQYLLVAVAIGAFYFLLSHHFIFYTYRDFDVLKKQELTLAYTFYSIRQHTPRDTLKIVPLRNAGIEDVLLERHLVSEQSLDRILRQIDSQ